MSEEFDPLCTLRIWGCDVERRHIPAMDHDAGPSVTRRCVKPEGDCTESSWSWGRNKPSSPSCHRACKHQVGLLSNHVPPPPPAPASVTQRHLGIPGRYGFSPAPSSTDQVKCSFRDEQLGAVRAAGVGEQAVKCIFPCHIPWCS